MAWTRRKTGRCDYVMTCTRLVVEGTAHGGRPRKTWQNTRSGNMLLLKVDPGTYTTVRNEGTIGWCKANPVASGTQP